MKRLPAPLLATIRTAMVLAAPVALMTGTALAQQPAPPPGHFDPRGKPPSSATLELRKQLKASLPFQDQRDLEENRRGFIAAPLFKKIMADAGNVAWDMEAYQWLLSGEDFSSIHPSLQRQAILNMAYGLYEVVPDHLYQVRGFDITNVTFVKSDTGWIVLDPGTAAETARAALAFINEKLGKRPVVGVVYSHSHVDHFGGVRGVVDEADVLSGKVKVIAPSGFMEAAVAENVFAGNAMSRRAQWQFAALLPRSPFGHVDQAIGKNTPAGSTGLIAPNLVPSRKIEEITVDGVTMVIQDTPDTEAPSAAHIYFPQFRGLWMAENLTGTIHNIYTLRGARVRDALNWSKEINLALYLFGQDAEVMFASHNWPRWGNARIQEVLRTARDTYANLNNQTLHYANQGVTINQIQNVYEVPESLQQQWAARSYHGDSRNNVRAVINRFLGHYDANPANLIPLSPEDSAPLYVEMMGGSARILPKGRELMDQGQYLAAVEILNKLVFAEPQNRPARELLADAYEQLGYQSESTSVRNAFLMGAYELRSGLPGGVPPRSTGPDVVRAMTTGQFLDFVGISLDPRKAAGIKTSINLVTPDKGEKYAIEVSNATMTNIEGYQLAHPDLTITANRSDLDQVIMGLTTFDQLVASGKARFDGNPAGFRQLGASLVGFTPDFEILPGTAPQAKTKPPKPFEVTGVLDSD